jgi:hypothetical protein
MGINLQDRLSHTTHTTHTPKTEEVVEEEEASTPRAR